MNSNTTERIVATIASVLITTVLLNSVIIGMTATAPEQRVDGLRPVNVALTEACAD